MANDLNNCQFIGRLGKDPEIRNMSNGDPVANFSLACGWKGKSSEGTEWVNCVAYGKLADIIGQYVRKGSQIYVSGKLKTRAWEKDGVKRYTTEINVDQMQLLGGKSDDGGQRQQQRAPAKSAGYDEDPIPF